jgi:hypothetical protein
VGVSEAQGQRRSGKGRGKRRGSKCRINLPQRLPHHRFSSSHLDNAITTLDTLRLQALRDHLFLSDNSIPSISCLLCNCLLGRLGCFLALVLVWSLRREGRA